MALAELEHGAEPQGKQLCYDTLAHCSTILLSVDVCAWLAAQLLDCDVMAAETLTELIKDNSDMVDEL